MRILILGAGIAGPTLAYWLAHYGFTPTIIEIAPRLRTGGYLIDFWGAGFEIAERMGLLPQIRSKGYMLQEVRVVNANGDRVAGFPAEAFFRNAHGRYVSLPRTELAASIFGKIEGNVESIFGDSVDRIEQTDRLVRVTLKYGGVREFDLIVGADGLHSRIRELAFGPEPQFEKYLGFKVAAFEVEGYQPRDEPAYVMYTQVGQQVGRFSLRGDRTMFHFTFADRDVNGPEDVRDQKALLRKRFGKSGWECPQILDALASSSDFYFDRVSQIRMDAQQGLWSRGRITLVGDAAFCVSLLAGQGSALAMVSAYILAGELRRANGKYDEAFRQYQKLFGPFVLKKQKAALRLAGSFAPKSKFALFLRNQIFNLMAIPWIADRVVGSALADKIELPDY
jgi:2-polyprenyl-6-methoxyphenol hydroxylase-like FAD-dependent oxidoreductase